MGVSDLSVVSPSCIARLISVACTSDLSFRSHFAESVFARESRQVRNNLFHKNDTYQTTCRGAAQVQHEGGTHTKVGVLLDSVTCRHTVLIFAMIHQNSQVVQNGVTAQCLVLVFADFNLVFVHQKLGEVGV